MNRMQPSRYPLLSVQAALDLVLASTAPLDTELVALADAFGRVLAEPIVSDADLPPFATTAVDGYAVVAGDVAAWRAIVAEVTAGNADAVAIHPGIAARIMTGAPLPTGTDAVVMVEQTVEENGRVRLQQPVAPGENIHPVGLDLRIGQRVLDRGQELGAPEIGLLATLGLHTVPVYRKPRVAVLATGDELVDYREAPGPGAIRDSNRPSLLAAVVEAGGEPISLGIGQDDEAEQTRIILDGLARADVLVTSGGVSVGSRDLIKPIFEQLGQVHVGRVAIKPGKPFTFATIGGKLAFGLPGFPVSTLVTFEVFVRPALRRLAGREVIQRPRVEVVLEDSARPAPDRTEYQRAVVRWLDGRLMARTTGAQVSSRLLSMIGANGLIIIEPGESELPAGTVVPALLTGEMR